MKRPRRAFLYSVSVVLVAGGLFGGARMYLSSSHAATRVALRLNTLLGVPVRVADVDIGIGGGSSLRGLEVFEAEEGRTETPWLSVEEIQADVSALDLLGDEAMPRLMLARAARLNLHFDRNDHLLTHLPKPHGPAGALPPIHVEEGQVTLNQEGRAP